MLILALLVLSLGIQLHTMRMSEKMKKQLALIQKQLNETA